MFLVIENDVDEEEFLTVEGGLLTRYLCLLPARLDGTILLDIWSVTLALETFVAMKVFRWIFVVLLDIVLDIVSTCKAIDCRVLFDVFISLFFDPKTTIRSGNTCIHGQKWWDYTKILPLNVILAQKTA